MFNKKVSGILSISILLASVVNLRAVGDVDQRNAVIQTLENQVQVKYGSSLWRNARASQVVRPGTQIRTGSLSKIELEYPDGTLTRIGSRTNYEVLDKSSRAVKVNSGKVWFKVTPKSAGLKIYSPTAVAAITGTEGFAEFETNEEEKESSSKSIMIASNDKNFSYKTAEAPRGGQFSFGLTSGSANVFRAGNDGEPSGNPMNIVQGQIITFNPASGFNLINISPGQIRQRNRDISQPDRSAGANSNTANNPNSANGNSSDSGNDNDNNENSGNNQNTANNPNNDRKTFNTNEPANQSLGPSNPTTEQVPNTINGQQDINNSPTVGDLEIIIK